MTETFAPDHPITLRFDRGTILLDGLEPGTAPPAPHLLAWDRRARRFRARAADYEELRRHLRRQLRQEGGGLHDRVLDLLPVAGFAHPPLRDYQHAALAAWQLGSRRGCVVLPTGAGKTHVALAALAECAAPSLVLVPTRVLLRQWLATLSEYYGGDTGALGDGSHEFLGVTVATYESARRAMPDLGNRFALLVVDEVHHFGAGSSFDEALEMCSAPCRLGLTATPPAAVACWRLASLVGPIRYELRVGDLADEHLARFKIVEMMLDLLPEERSRYDAARAIFLAEWCRFRACGSGAPWQEFVRACRQSQSGRDALRAWHRARKLASWTRNKAAALDQLLARHRGSRTIVFTGDKDAAYAIARRQWIMPITSDISRPERKWALEAFSTGELHALVAARVLNEGIDVPAADVAIVVGSSQGAREYVQRVGRILRPRPGKRAIVYELVSADTTEVGQAIRRRDVLGATAARPPLRG